MSTDVIGPWEIEFVGNLGAYAGCKAGFYVNRKVSGPSFCPNARQWLERRGALVRFGSREAAQGRIDKLVKSKVTVPR